MGAPDKRTSTDKKAFFSGLHLVVTGVAALATAAVAVLGLALNQGWLGGGSTSRTGSGAAADVTTSVAAPQYGVDPGSITFSPVGPTTASIEVSNTGVVPIKVEPPTVTGPNAPRFSVSSQCDSPVEPGRSCQLQVTFRQMAGTFNALVVIQVTGAVRATEVPVKASALF